MNNLIIKKAVVDLKGNVIYDRGAEIDKEARKIENIFKRDCEQSRKSLYLKNIFSAVVVLVIVVDYWLINTQIRF